MEQLLADSRHRRAAGLRHPVVPLQKIALRLPAIAVDVEFGGKKRESLLDGTHILVPDVQLEPGQEGQHPLLHRADVLSRRIQDVETVSPGQLALHGIDGVPRLVVDVVAVKPGEQPLLE